MNKPEWMPVNPCTKCTNYKEYRFFYTDCPVSGDCHKELDYKYGVPAQYKLLEYLIAECNKSASIAVAKELLESMIEELEVNQ